VFRKDLQFSSAIGMNIPGYHLDLKSMKQINKNETFVCYNTSLPYDFSPICSIWRKTTGRSSHAFAVRHRTLKITINDFREEEQRDAQF
jgi:hypothetical protein